MCNGTLDQPMEHGFCCLNMGHGRLHNFVKYATFKAIKQVADYVGDQVSMEPPIHEFLKDIPENYTEQGSLKLRRGDIAIVDTVRKTTIIVDVRTCAMTAKSQKEVTIVDNGEKEKHEFYARVCEFPDGITMLPMAIDTYGRIGDEFKDFLSVYCKQAAMATNNSIAC